MRAGPHGIQYRRPPPPSGSGCHTAEARPVVTEHDPSARTGPVFCARCAAELWPGAGNFFRVTIEAVADPTPPVVTDEDLAVDHRREIERLLAQLEGVSGQEAMDQ